jgi:hypothetical protein
MAAGPSIGDKIAFGDLTWRVLSVQSHKALLIANDAIRKWGFHVSDKEDSVEWGTSQLREWLNGFFLSSMPKDILPRILEVKLDGYDNSKYGISSDPGLPQATTDRVFLLSADEAELYFRDPLDRVAKYNSSFLKVKDPLGSIGSDDNQDGDTVWWGLRTPAVVQNTVCTVALSGNIDNVGTRIDCGFIRSLPKMMNSLSDNALRGGTENLFQSVMILSTAKNNPNVLVSSFAKTYYANIHGAGVRPAIWLGL